MTDEEEETIHPMDKFVDYDGSKGRVGQGQIDLARPRWLLLVIYAESTVGITHE
jgi:hypothetical protein